MIEIYSPERVRPWYFSTNFMHITMALYMILLLLMLNTALGEDLGSDQRALLAFRVAVAGQKLRWAAGTNACTWTGIGCRNKRVILVSLPACGLMGKIPLQTLGNLTMLRILRLRENKLQGPLPTDLTQCKELRTLYLQRNSFEGSLPQDLSEWKNLVRLNLARNNFTGPIPDSLAELNRLGTVQLEENRFVGGLPELNLERLVQFNVSFNNLTGEIPDGLKGFGVSAFSQNAGLCGEPLAPCPLSSTPRAKKKNYVLLVVGIAIGATAIILLCLVVMCVLVGRKKKKERDHHKRSSVKGGGADISSSIDDYSTSMPESLGNDRKLVFFREGSKGFGLEDLLRASAEVLGRGTVGTSYKAVLEVGCVVVVKRLKDVAAGPRDFAVQMSVLGKMRHKNLVVVKAYYYSAQEKLLVSEYMPMGSLSALLHGSKGSGHTLLDWDVRVKISMGVAEGIEHIHRHGSKVTHGNIKSSNVLLTEQYTACISDYGLTQIAKPIQVDGRKVGYRAPEVTETHAITQKADVYSFGVLLLEMLTGRAPTQASLSDEGVDLPRWVQSVVKEEWTSEVFDLELLKEQSAEEEMVQLLQIAMACVHEHPDQRPAITEVVKMIRGISNRFLEIAEF